MRDAYGSDAFVLKSASFAQAYRSEILSKLMYVRSVTRVFHTCGKNCGNSPGNAQSAVQFGSESRKTVNLWFGENSPKPCIFEPK